ncbi:DUF1150 family protein [Pseudohoeflea coraliihabitans]|uniref:DUF1150 family protein n=1 Tax=Pseudohoeflea coraliihabitans TaxID=2860393 RepID=A0ABS6WQC3_9HYPH|nr:DUF1150 family protein [Pseudohoeflea sp. DP4N28-3]MBW3097587.1 DUF1150 family protein [Pseudohoeflea sp. DP4N28-3]
MFAKPIREVTDATAVSAAELAALGAGQVGYIRRMTSEEVNARFPDSPKLGPGLELWALFGADGTPILLTDDRSSTFYRAAEDELKTVSVH